MRRSAAGFSDDEAWDIAAIAAMFAMSNRLANAFSIRPNDEFYLMGVRRAADPNFPGPRHDRVIARPQRRPEGVVSARLPPARVAAPRAGARR